MKIYGAFCALVLAFIVSGCAGPVVLTQSKDDSGALVGLYNLKPLDPLFVSLLGIPEEKELQLVVDEYGQINLPYIAEPVQVSGLSISEVERKIQDIYIEGRIYSNVTVNIQTSSKSYFMEGEVNQPTEYPLDRPITLLQAIAAAGGYTDFADKTDITITRGGKNIEVNAKKIERNPELDIPLEAGDRIKIDRTFY